MPKAMSKAVSTGPPHSANIRCAMKELEEMLQPAIGYFKLGMHQEANDALEMLPPAVITSREVMTLRARIYQKIGSS